MFKRNSKTLLIIKNDGIGDYVLFRNYIRFLKNSASYKNYKIYLLANISSKDLAIFLDKDNIDGFYWYADGFFLKWDLVKLLFKLQKLKLSTIIYTNYSRKFAVDWLVKNIIAPNKIGVKGNNTNYLPSVKKTGDGFYTQLITVDHAQIHEFERNKQILEAITQEKCTYKKPVIDKTHLNIIQNNGIIIFPGASDKNRKWPAENFNRLCRLIVSKLDNDIILAGGHHEIADGKIIEKGIDSHRINNRVGLLNLVELCGLIGGAKLLVSNDTVAIHMAVALNVNAICISKGDLYGRFIPYPTHISKQITCVFPAGFKPNRESYNNWSSINISTISAQTVFDQVEKLLL